MVIIGGLGRFVRTPPTYFATESMPIQFKKDGASPTTVMGLQTQDTNSQIDLVIVSPQSDRCSENEQYCCTNTSLTKTWNLADNLHQY